MNNYLKYFLLGLFIVLFDCSKDDAPSNNNGGGGGLVAQATYSIVFKPNFTEDTHPVDYPANAGFSKMVLVAHGAGTDVFTLGNLASDGLKKYVEEGETSDLEIELSSSELNPTVVRTGMDINPSGEEQSWVITITPETTKISFVSKISPSPDWFVGVDAVELFENGLLADLVAIRLFPVDGGTDSGTTYNAPNEPEPGPITLIQGSPFADPGNGGVVAPLGELIITKLE